MIKVKVKTNNNIHLNVPVPYLVLRVFSSILTSKTLLKLISKAASQHAGKKTIPFTLLNHSLPKQLLKEMIRELYNHRGLVLVDAKLKDGTEVLVRL